MKAGREAGDGGQRSAAARSSSDSVAGRSFGIFRDLILAAPNLHFDRRTAYVLLGGRPGEAVSRHPACEIPPL